MPHFLFERLSLQHIRLLEKWMQEPHVKYWWGEGKEWTYEKLLEKYHSYTLGYKMEQGEEKPIFAYLVCWQNRPIGFIQMYDAFDFPREGFQVKEVWSDRFKSLAAIDFYIGDAECIGKGIGSIALREFLDGHVFPSFDACLVDPEKNNIAAIKAYTKAGFSKILEYPSCLVMIAYKEVSNIKKNELLRS